MITRKGIEKLYTVIDGIIRTPGKFEGQPAWVPYYWDLGIDGCADADGNGKDTPFIFHLDSSDSYIWPELARVFTITLATDAHGNVKHTIYKEAA